MGRSCLVTPLRGCVWTRKVGKGESVVDQGRHPGRGGQETRSGPPACSGEASGGWASRAVLPAARLPCGPEQLLCLSGQYSYLHPRVIEITHPFLGFRAWWGGVELVGRGLPQCPASSLSSSPFLCLSSQRQACHLTILGSEEEPLLDQYLLR